MTDADGYLAKPISACCMKGHLHEGEPRGRYEDIHGVKSYIATPSTERANGNILLYFPDVWGFFNNGMLIMDGFADAGYLTIGLDYFRDDPIWKHRKNKDDPAPDFDLPAWKHKHITYADAMVPGWVKEVKSKYGKTETKFACVGYCFGAPYVCDELARDTVSAGAFAHPAYLKDQHFENLQLPLFMSCSEIDQTFSTESRNRAVDIMDKEGKAYQLQLFSGVEHGFALRGNPENPYERYVKEQSLKGIAEFFDFWLAQPAGTRAKASHL